MEREVAVAVKRAAKGVVVTAVAAWVGSVIATIGLGLSEERTRDSGGLRIDFTPLIFNTLSVVAVSLVIFAGMRILREARNALLIAAAAVSWFFVASSFDHSEIGSAQWLTVGVYGIGGGAVSWITRPRHEN